MASSMREVAYVRRTGQLSEQMAGEEIVLDIERDHYFRLSRSATQLWPMLATPHTVSELTDAVVRTFDVDDATARLDVAAWLDELVRKGLVEPARAP